MLDTSRITYLLNQVVQGQATAPECEQLLQLLRSGDSDEALEQMNAFYGIKASRPADLPVFDIPYWKAAAQEVLQVTRGAENVYITKSPIPVHSIHFLKRTWFRYAAIILLIAASATYLYMANQSGNETAFQEGREKPDILPGGNKAILTLSDGSTIALDSALNGELAQQGSARIIKLNSGELAYNSVAGSGGELLYNTISTPRGGQYQITLADGSKVWLNAASSLRYPAGFNRRERRVEITGEAYFEITDDKARPFSVSIKDRAEVEVLGTSFNVNSYDDEENIKTTLVKGRVRVHAIDRHTSLKPDIQQSKGIGSVQPSRTRGIVLKPGQQARITNGTGSATADTMFIAIIENADIASVTAWKDGLFNFEGAGFQEVMNQLERWYDITVVYEKGVPDIRFGGKLSKNIKLNELLRILEISDVHFRMEEGRRLVVLP